MRPLAQRRFICIRLRTVTGLWQMRWTTCSPREVARLWHDGGSSRRLISPQMTKAPRFRAFTTERVTGIEPALSAWEADVLPLNYTREPGDLIRRPGLWRSTFT